MVTLQEVRAFCTGGTTKEIRSHSRSTCLTLAHVASRSPNRNRRILQKRCRLPVAVVCNQLMQSENGLPACCGQRRSHYENPLTIGWQIEFVFERVHAFRCTKANFCSSEPIYHRKMRFRGFAGGGARTHTALRPLDFESSASANSATPALGGETIRDSRISSTYVAL